MQEGNVKTDALVRIATLGTRKYALLSQKMATEGGDVLGVKIAKIITQNRVMNQWRERNAAEETADFII